MKSPNIFDISAVVCCWNSIDSIEDCLKSLKKCGIGELIVVDGGSVDGTLEIAEKYADKVLGDDGIGLGNARNIGLMQASMQFVLNSGPDNMYSLDCLNKMLSYFPSAGTIAVSCKTLVNSEKYLGRLLNIYKKARYFSGERLSIGTPLLCEAEVIKAHPFDETHKFSDDAELCHRWGKELDAKFFIAECHVLEIGKVNISDLQSRWKMYGISDHEVFLSQSGSWSLPRKIGSILYPFKHEVALPLVSSRISFKEKCNVLWFLVFIVIIRYSNWFRSVFFK